MAATYSNAFIKLDSRGENLRINMLVETTTYFDVLNLIENTINYMFRK